MVFMGSPGVLGDPGVCGCKEGSGGVSVIRWWALGLMWWSEGHQGVSGVALRF